MEELRHLVDEGAGAARAGAVHALLGGGVEVGDLGVLAAELDDDVGVGVLRLDGLGLGDDLLDEGQVHDLGEGEAGGAGDGAAHGHAGELLGDLAQQTGDLAADVGVVAAVLDEDGLGEGLALAPLGQEDDLDGGGADVEAHAQGCGVGVDDDGGARGGARGPGGLALGGHGGHTEGDGEEGRSRGWGGHGARRRGGGHGARRRGGGHGARRRGGGHGAGSGAGRSGHRGRRGLGGPGVAHRSTSRPRRSRSVLLRGRCGR